MAKSKARRDKQRRCKHDWRVLHFEQRHHRRTGKYLGQASRERCERCDKTRLVDCETGRTIQW
jgi:hypothetical protein